MCFQGMSSVALFAFCRFIIEYLNGTQFCLGEDQIKFSLMRIKFAPHFHLYKKPNCITTQSISRIFMFFILMNWEKIEENSGKKALQQAMWQKASYTCYDITCMTHCHHDSSQKTTIVSTKAVIHTVSQTSLCVYPQAFQASFKELGSSQCQNSIYQLQNMWREWNKRASSMQE